MGGNMTKRQMAAMETRRKLIEAAKEIISEKGLVNTSIEEITNACGVSNGTFYTYFKRKEDIVFELSNEMYAEIYEMASKHKGAFMERLIFFMVNFSGYIEKSSLKLCQEWVRNNADPDILEVPEGKNKLELDTKLVKELILKGIEKGELKEDTPADILAHTLVDILYGEMLCWDMSGGNFSFRERTEEFCRLFLNSVIGPYLK